MRCHCESAASRRAPCLEKALSYVTQYTYIVDAEEIWKRMPQCFLPGDDNHSWWLAHLLHMSRGLIPVRMEVASIILVIAHNELEEWMSREKKNKKALRLLPHCGNACKNPTPGPPAIDNPKMSPFPSKATPTNVSHFHPRLARMQASSVRVVLNVVYCSKQIQTNSCKCHNLLISKPLLK